MPKISASNAMTTDPTRPPPAAIMAENAILSTFMQLPAEFIPRGIAEGLTDESFSTQAKQICFRAIVDDFTTYGNIDLTAFVQRRQLDGKLDRMGDRKSTRLNSSH